MSVERQENDTPIETKSGDEKEHATVGRRLGSAALLLSGGVLLSRFLGYIREAVIAYQGGASLETDAYYAAFTIPDLMNYFLAGGTLSITFVPLFSAYLSRDREAEGWRLFSTIATLTGSLLLVGVIVGEIWTEDLLQELFSFEGETLALTAHLTRIVLPAQIFFYLGGLIAATQMARGHFKAVALAPLIYNAVIILCGVALSPWIGMSGFAVGALLGAALGPFGLNLWSARKHLRFTLSFDWRSEGLKKFVFLSLPLMLGVSLISVDEWIGRVLGSAMEEGSISWLNYARRLMMVPIAVLAQAAGQAALPFMAQLAAQGRLRELGELLEATLRRLMLLSIIATALIWALAEPLVTLIYERGAFQASDSLATAQALRFFAVGIAAWGIQGLAARAFYAAQNTLTPMILSTVVTLASLPLYSWLAGEMGIQGLAFAATLGIIMQAIVTLFFYSRQNPHLKLLVLFKTFATGSFIGALAGGIAWSGDLLLSPLVAHWPRTLASFTILLLAGGAGGLSALFLASRLRLPEWIEIEDRLLSRWRRKN